MLDATVSGGQYYDGGGEYLQHLGQYRLRAVRRVPIVNMTARRSTRASASAATQPAASMATMPASSTKYPDLYPAIKDQSAIIPMSTGSRAIRRSSRPRYMYNAGYDFRRLSSSTASAVTATSMPMPTKTIARRIVVADAGRHPDLPSAASRRWRRFAKPIIRSPAASKAPLGDRHLRHLPRLMVMILSAVYVENTGNGRCTDDYRLSRRPSSTTAISSHRSGPTRST